MDKKSIEKRYLISVFALYFIGAAILCAFIIAAGESEAEIFSNIDLDVLMAVRIALIAAAIPAGAYTGAVITALKFRDIDKSKAVFVIIFFPFILAFTIIFGIIMLIPYTVYSIIKIIRG